VVGGVPADRVTAAMEGLVFMATGTFTPSELKREPLVLCRRKWSSPTAAVLVELPLAFVAMAGLVPDAMRTFVTTL